MSHKIIILQHTPLVTPGYFTNLMSEDFVETIIIRLDEGEKIPVNLDIFNAVSYTHLTLPTSPHV